MKKNYILFITSLISIYGIKAQPVLNATDFNTKYSATLYTAENEPGLSAGNAGANQTWDFSGLTSPTLYATISVVPNSTTPYKNTFPDANYVIKYAYADNSPTFYTYNTVTTSKFETNGAAGNSEIYEEVDPLTIFSFPYTYGKSFTDTTQEKGSSVQTITSTYDGYGTLITPFETFTNVIRIKTQESTPSYSFTDYTWYSVNPFKVLMLMDFNSNNDTATSNYVEVYTNFATLGLKDFAEKSAVNLYPNPVKNILTLELAGNLPIDKIKITNVLGTVVIDQNKVANQINVDTLASGVYFVEVVSGTVKFQQKFLKL